VSLAAISTDNTAKGLEMVELTGAEFAILSDEDAAVARDYGVYNLLNDSLAAPSVFIITPGGHIEWRYVGENVSDRPAPDEILAQVDRLIR
jgi:peroxiredoxin